MRFPATLTGLADHEFSTVFWLKTAVSTGLLAGFLLSPKLWLSSRLYPLAPVARFLRPVPPPFDYAAFIAWLLLLAWIAVRPRPAKAIAVFVAIACGFALCDQSRWQPWFYQYVFMLIALGLLYAKPDSAERRDSALDACRWIVAAIYFWSGIHKANATFVHESFPWMIEPFIRFLPGIASRGLTSLGFATPAIEAAVGIGLLTRRFRKAAVIAAVGMHLFILASIGPQAHNWDSVVWPWNLAMAWSVVLLFWREEGGVRKPKSVYQTVVLILFGIAPALSFVNLLDGYPSFSLYSGNNNSATIYMSDTVAGRLPDGIQEQIDVNDSEVDELDLFEWSFAELKVPPYAEPRVFRQIGKQLCAQAGQPREMALVIQTKSTWIRRKRQFVYDCESLR